MAKLKILVIDDDPNICELISLYADKQGYQAFSANDGATGIDILYEASPDLVVLDIMLPEMDGWEICKFIREGSSVPIIMLTGRGESYDKVKGLEIGADDYMVKPFDPKELMARIKAVLRRIHPSIGETAFIEFPSLFIDMNQYIVKSHSRDISMAPKEIELLYYLASHQNKVITRQQIVDQIWGFDYDGDPRTVDVHIKRIREKIGQANEYWMLKTIRGIGYKFEVSS
jgi:DNA-binding response OmpR family regulator